MGVVIPATNPVVTQAVSSITYDKWYLTQLIIKANATSSPAIVHLRRASVDTNTGAVTLMPDGPGAEVSFMVDIFQQLTAFPAFGTAMESVLQAVVAYATSKKLL